MRRGGIGRAARRWAGAGLCGPVSGACQPDWLDRSSGANVVTAGNWRLTLRILGARATYDLTLHPNSTVTGTGRWTISRANVAGRWLFDPAGQILHLELSGGIEEGTKVIPVKVVRWNSARDADCMFEHRRAHLEKLPPAGR